MAQTIKVYLIGRHEVTGEQLKRLYSKWYTNPQFVELPQITEADISLIQKIGIGDIMMLMR
jgi:N-acetyl-gamma-glutamylphosphate reductase